MKKWLSKYLPYVIIGICLVWIGKFMLDSRNPSVVTVHSTDTVFVTKVDTLELVSPIFVTKKVVDTLIVYVNDSSKVSLPIEQKRYLEPDKYDLYISGVNPRLDTIRVFNKTEYQTITKTITNTVYPKVWSGYVSANVMSIDTKLAPSVNVMLVSPKKLMLGAGIGIYDNKPIYNVTVGLKMW